MNRPKSMEVQTGDAISVSQFTAITKNIKLSFGAEKNRRFVMLLLGEQGDDEEFDPEAMLNKLGWVRKDEN
jgi:hypothetical protein